MAKTKRGGVLPHPRKNRKRWTKSRLVLNVGACILVFLLFLFLEFYLTPVKTGSVGPKAGLC